MVACLSIPPQSNFFLTGINEPVIVAALLTTLAPARRAARIYPAEALRYQ